jgi:hypothetical protein
MWNDWVNENYEFLELWAKRWAGENWADLLSHYCEYLNKNWHKFSQIPDGEERLKWTQTWMKNMVKWTNSDFNKMIRVNSMPDEWEIPDESYDALLEVSSETDREDLRDWLLDLHRNFSDLEVNRLIKMRQIYIKLETYEKVVWDLYFTNMLSLRAMASKLKLPLSSVHNMVVELKEKIKIKYGMDN